MAKINIDGKDYEVANGRTVIEAARENGIEIPHFCWHPKLSVSGNCRMCLVEIEKMPKLAIACSTQVADGMVVRTMSERAVKAREAVMEFLLINHPLDCPICDEAGECKLQDYSYKYSTGISRFDEDKIHKPKRVPLGPNVMFDAERCILCSRCIRFCDEVVGKHQLQFVQRGDRTTIETFPGEHLDNPYSMNVIELCPVGALTSRDFRFKARVWELSSTDSVCTGCARGCNMNIWVRNNEILRLTPRYNEAVNGFWMCDHGRLDTFKHISSETRLLASRVRREGDIVDVSWDEAIARAASELKTYKGSEIAGIGSPYATNEDNYIFVKFMRDVIGTKHIDFVQDHTDGDEDALLIRADKTPNTTGALEVGLKPLPNGLDFKGILGAISEGKIRALYLLDHNIAVLPGVTEILAKLDLLVVHATNENETTRLADIVIHCSTYAERHGTFTNFERRVQRIRPAVATLDIDRALDGLAMSRLDKFGTQFDKWGKAVKRDARPTWRIIASIASLMGVKYKFGSAEEVFNELASTIPAFKGLTYGKIGSQGMQLNR